ncbi:hypothetical protein [Streptomyces sp. NPDC055210]
MTAACGLCGSEVSGRYLCERDTIALAARLTQLPDLDAELVMHLVPARSGFGELATVRAAGPRSPINESVFDEIRDNRAGEIVHSWRVDVQYERWPQHSPPPRAGLATDCRWLGMELDWIAVEYPAAGELAREVRELESGLRSLVGDPLPRLQRLGTCIAVTDDQGTVCGAPLTRLPGQTLRCRQCSKAYRNELDMLLLLKSQPRKTA